MARIITVEVRGDEVDLPISVEVSRAESSRRAIGSVVDDWLEGAITVAQVNFDGALPSYCEIDFVVMIEVGNDDRPCTQYRASARRIKCAIAIAQHDKNVVPGGVGQREIEISITVEIRRNDADRIARSGVQDKRLKRAISVANSYGNAISVVTGDGDVELAVVVEVADGNLAGVVIDSGGTGLGKCSITIPQVSHDATAHPACHHQIHFAVAIEIRRYYGTRGKFAHRFSILQERARRLSEQNRDDAFGLVSHGNVEQAVPIEISYRDSYWIIPNLKIGAVEAESLSKSEGRENQREAQNFDCEEALRHGCERFSATIDMGKKVYSESALL